MARRAREDVVAKFLTSNNAEIFRQLGSRPFRDAAVEHEVATSGRELVERARAARPALVILDRLLPDGSGFEVCRRIKDDPQLAPTRVMLLLDNPATQEQLRDAELSGCDAILCLPAPGEELFGHIAALLGFPSPDSRRVREKLLVELDLGKTRVRGEVTDLGETTARARLGERIVAPPRAPARFSRAVTGASFETIAAVSWQRQPAPGAEWEAGLKYERIDEAVLARLRAPCLWNVTSVGDGAALVVLRGDFVESTDFAPLLAELAAAQRVQLDLMAVSRLNSVGASRWTELVAALAGREISFLRCSLEFTSHAAMASGMLGGGRVESLVAPYACEACGASELRLLQVAAVYDGAAIRPPALRCGACGGTTLFDDIPERYFSFLLA
jgi:CheY-like chemotaxis protein